jgi:hypothetical protein
MLFARIYEAFPLTASRCFPPPGVSPTAPHLALHDVLQDLDRP